MMKQDDIFGIAFSDYLAGNTQAVIGVRTKLPGHTELEELPVAYFFRTPQQMPVYERQALDACRGRILDAGAGAGAHALELQTRGFTVRAIDLSAGAVRTMKMRGIQDASQKDFYALTGEKYDTILFLMNGIGMAKTLPGLAKLFLHARRLLNPRGQILLESTDILYMYQEEDGSVLLPMGHSYYGEIVYQLSYGKHTGSEFQWLFADYDNLSDVATGCGYEPALLYEGADGNYLAALKLRD